MRRLPLALILAAASGFGATSGSAEARTTQPSGDALARVTPAPAPTPAGQRPMSMGASRADDRTASSLPTCPQGDPMVWLDTKTRTYYVTTGAHPKRTAHGHFACTSGAAATGASEGS